MMQARALGFCTALASLLLGVVHPAQAGGEDARVRALTEAYNAAGQALYRELARKPGNVVFSPYSIGAVMALARSGARGETERQMASALKLRQEREETDAANTALAAILNGYDKTSHPDYCPKGARWTGNRCEGPPSSDGKCRFPMQRERDVCVGEPVAPSAKLLTANALMLAKRGALISAEYRSMAKDKYFAEIYEGADAGEVNGWVKRKTEGKIDRIVDRLEPDTAAVLLNAVYFKAAWASTLMESATREDEFRVSAAQKVRVPMMRQQASFRLVEGTRYRAIRLDYSERALGMIIVLPNEVEGLDAVTRQLDTGELENLVSALRHVPTKPVSLALPRFKTAFEADLVEPFRKAGMTLAFTDRADFSGMTGRNPTDDGVKIGAIKHRAIIEVVEEGTEAAAATAVVFPSLGLPREQPKPISFIVDHPFLFSIVDDASGAILFQGRIANPLQG
jgi:serpin B